MVGGKEEHVETCMPVFEAMGSRIEHMGPWGSGAAAKLVNQVRLRGTLAGVFFFAEGQRGR